MLHVILGIQVFMFHNFWLIQGSWCWSNQRQPLTFSFFLSTIYLAF